MTAYLISYDNHAPRNYTDLYTLMNTWGAKRILESLWVANLNGPSAVIRDTVKASLGVNDGVFVVQAHDDWASSNCQADGVALLKVLKP